MNQAWWRKLNDTDLDYYAQVSTSLSFWSVVFIAYFISGCEALKRVRPCWWLGAVSLKKKNKKTDNCMVENFNWSEIIM